MSSTLLRQATIVHGPVTDGSHDGTPCDVLVVDGVISEVAAAVGPDAILTADDTIDLAGHLLLPAAVEPHAHLDKAFLAERAENLTGDLAGAIDAMIALSGTITHDDIVERAERAARLMATNGFAAVRTHADTTRHTGLVNVEALVEVRRRVADVIDVEIVALAGMPVAGDDGAAQRSLLRDALAAGADLIGGCPHLEPDGQIEAATDTLLQIAEDGGVGVDLHTDETLDPAVMGLEHLARQVLAGFEHPVTASHCVSLGQRNAAEQQRIAELVAEAGIGVVALPHTNLWLGGRNQQPVPRGLTAIDALRTAGVAVAAGADNLQDPFNPVGRACPFETAGLMVMAAHLLAHEAWAMVTETAAQVLQRTPATVAPGERADLLAVRAATVREAIAFGPNDRMVWHRGHTVPSA